MQRRRQQPCKLLEDLGLNALARVNEFSSAAAGSRQTTHEVLACAGANAKRKDASRGRVFGGQRDGRIGICDLAVGQQNDLSR
jgi:hypothetical protein